MMPVIRISDEVMDMLKKFAEPFVDTPDTVLRKILGAYAEMKGVADQGKSVPSPHADEHLRVSLPREFPSKRFPRRTRTIERGAMWIVAA